MTGNLKNGLNVNPANAAMIAFYDRAMTDGRSYVEVHVDKVHHFDIWPEQKEKLLELIRAEGDRYHWLFGNVAINLERVTMVEFHEGAGSLSVYFGGDKWESPRVSSAREIYQKYMAVMEARRVSPSAVFHAAAGKNPQADVLSLANAEADLDRMIGLENGKREVKENLAYLRFEQVKRELGVACVPAARHMALLGHPGTGKTSFARKITALYYAAGLIPENKMVEVTRKDVVAEYIGQTAKKMEAVIKKAVGGVLFIDEAYDLVRNSGTGNNDYGVEAINTLVPAMENHRDDLIVIFAGYHDKMLEFLDMNPGLQSRCPNIILFDDYNMDELKQIMQLMVAERGLTLSAAAEEAAMKMIAANKAVTPVTSFGNARTVRNLVEKAERAHALRLSSTGLLPDVVDPAQADRVALLTLQPEDIAAVKLDMPKTSANQNIYIPKKRPGNNLPG